VSNSGEYNDFGLAGTAKKRVRSAVKRFIVYPSLNTLSEIQDVCFDVWTAPCQIGQHSTLVRRVVPECLECPLSNLDLKIDKYSSCPLSIRRTQFEIGEIWEQHKGELLIAMVQFNEGFE
jgi:hypothetical protein